MTAVEKKIQEMKFFWVTFQLIKVVKIKIFT